MRKIYSKSSHILCKFFAFSDNDKKWILDYLCGGKGAIPYEQIKSYENLYFVPEGEFYKMTEFYSSLKNEFIKPNQYENVKKNLAQNEN